MGRRCEEMGVEGSRGNMLNIQHILGGTLKKALSCIISYKGQQRTLPQLSQQAPFPELFT